MAPSEGLNHTPLYDRHVALGAKIIEFAGWQMPLSYPGGTVAEHLATRRKAGLFDVSHMGRILVGGARALELLQSVLSNDAAALDLLRAHYTFLPTPTGGAVDDAYLYRIGADSFLLVVNAANLAKDWAHLETHLRLIVPTERWSVCAPGSAGGAELELHDVTARQAMLSLQGPESSNMLGALVEAGTLPGSRRNAVSTVTIAGMPVLLSRTGYTGEPLGFELFLPGEAAPLVWDLLVEKGAVPCGLGARDTLRLEAGLPLYGHELGTDQEGREIPLFASPLASFAVSFAPEKGDFVGREGLLRQQAAWQAIAAHDFSKAGDLPRVARPLALTGRGVARTGARVSKDGQAVGWVTSGTMVPYWKTEGTGADARPGDEHGLRPICLALLDCRLAVNDRVVVDVRGSGVEGLVVPHHLRSDTPPYARPVVYL